MKTAVRMIELVFVIVVIGILAGVAIPKFAATRDDAIISKARATVASVRSALATERQKRILRGVFTNISATDVGTNFDNLLEYSVKSCSSSKCGGWSTSGTTYTFHGPTGDIDCTLNANKLDCESGLD
jgi:general secretion pathway protein G